MAVKKYILWDNDGVLVETEMWYYAAGKKTLAELDFNMNMDDYMKIMVQGTSVFDLIADRGLSEDTVNGYRARRDVYYQEYLLSENLEIPHVEEVLSRLAGSFNMGIVTSSRREDFDLIHKNRPFVKYMDFVLAGGEYPHWKPHPDPYLAGLKKLGGRAEETVVVEDSQRGLASARAAGIDCIIIENEFTRSQDFSGASAILKSIRDVPDYLLNR